MADIKYYDVILKPVITEKSMAGMGEKKYTFLVHTEANKSQIKEAVEKMFEGTKVKKVNTINMDGKNKRRGMVYGKTAKTKKAIVKLTADSKDIWMAVDITNLDTKAIEATLQVWLTEDSVIGSQKKPSGTDKYMRYRKPMWGLFVRASSSCSSFFKSFSKTSSFPSISICAIKRLEIGRAHV